MTVILYDLYGTSFTPALIDHVVCEQSINISVIYINKRCGQSTNNNNYCPNIPSYYYWQKVDMNL